MPNFGAGGRYVSDENQDFQSLKNVHNTKVKKEEKERFLAHLTQSDGLKKG